MEKEKTEMEKLLEKVEGLEKSLKETQEENATLKKNNEDLTTRLTKLKVDGLTQKVDTGSNNTKVEEPIQFDFDM